MTKKADRPEEGPACPRCQQTNRPARSFCRRCGLHLNPQPVERARADVGKTSTPGASRAPQRRARPAPVSAKRAGKADERRAVVALVVARDKVCQAANLHALISDLPCGGRLDPHERIPRSAWAAGYYVADNVVLVCEHAHRWIDNHPNGAHALGLHGYSWERPDGHAGGGTDGESL